MGVEQRRQQKASQAKALTIALKQRAAALALQTSYRRFAGLMVKRGLRRKRAKFLREVMADADGEGRAEAALIALQRRTRRWLDNRRIGTAPSTLRDHRDGGDDQ